MKRRKIVVVNVLLVLLAVISQWGCSKEPNETNSGKDAIENSAWFTEVQKKIGEDQYRFAFHDNRHLAANAKQNFNSTFDADGWQLQPQVNEASRKSLAKIDRSAKNFHSQYSRLIEETVANPDWKLHLAYSGVGRAKTETGSDAILTGNVNVKPEIGECDGTQRVGAGRACIRQLEYRRKGVTEYIRNEARGVEQGFIVANPPKGAGERLVVGLKFAGLQARSNKDGQSIVFSDGRTDRVKYSELLVKDSTGKQLDARMGIVGNEIRIVVADAEATYPIHIDPIATTASWVFYGETVDAWLGHSVSTAGDVNGDGYADVIVGAFKDNSNTGKAYVFHGSANGLSTTADWTAVGEDTANWFGEVVAHAGDVNCDGFSDVLVSATGFSPSADAADQDKGKVYLYYGSASGLSTSPDWTAVGETVDDGLGSTLASAGDVNANGCSDVAIGTYYFGNWTGKVYVYHGSSSGLPGTADWTADGENVDDIFAGSISQAGDVNGDGYGDFLVGALGFNSYQGKAYVYYGSSLGLSASPDQTYLGDPLNLDGDALGEAVSRAGDINGDGYGDILIGGSGIAGVHAYYGSASGPSATPDWSYTAAFTESGFGEEATTAGDINGDGYADILISETGEDSVYVFFGSLNGLNAIPDETLTDSPPFNQYGSSISMAGDVNGDGYGDVIVGDRLYDVTGSDDQGRALLYMGSATGLATASKWSDAGEAVGNYFGAGVSTAGDVNGDGYGDLIVGAPGYSTYTGRAYVYHGSETGFSTTADWTATGAGALYGFGAIVKGGGDINGDGFGDVVISAPGYSTYRGLVYAYNGSAAGLAASPSWSVSGTTSNVYFGASLDIAGDVNGDGYADVVVGAYGVSSSRGQVFVYHGSGSGLPTTADWTKIGENTGDVFATSAAGAGDVNGDGYSDLIVGATGFNSDAGKAYLYYGSADGLATTAAWTATGENGGDAFGAAVASAGDVNGNGFSDILIGANGFDAYRGKAYLYMGWSGGLSASQDWSATGEAVGDEFATSLAGAGDVNGDGYTDIIIGAPNNNTDAGKVYAYYGSASGLSTSADWTQTGAATEQFGRTVAAAGDGEADTYADVIIGAPGTGTIAGTAYAFHGNLGGGQDMLMRQYDITTPDRIMAGSFSQSGDIFVGIATRNWKGRSRVKVQWEVIQSNAPFIDSNVQTAAAWSDTGNPASLQFLGNNLSGLTLGAVYHWRARYLLEFDGWSPWYRFNGSGMGNGFHFRVPLEPVTTGCTIGLVDYNFGDANPANECQWCDPNTSTAAWTNRIVDYPCSDDSLSCTRDVCNGAGTCTHNLFTGCLIGGVCVAEGTDNPSNSCQECDTAQSTSAYSNIADGAACADDNLTCTSDVCEAGACTHALVTGCLIDGNCIAEGADNPANECQECDTAQSTSAYSNIADGAACAGDGLTCTSDVCMTGACTHSLLGGCLINGVCIADGVDDPANECAECIPAASTSTYTAKPNGVACTDDALTCTTDVCSAGACSHSLVRGCLIGGVCIADGADDPDNECAECIPVVATDIYSNKADGVACIDDNLTCTSDVCMTGVCEHDLLTGCLIDDVCIADGAIDPDNECALCVPRISTSEYTPKDNGEACSDDDLTCTADACMDGVCEHTLGSGCLIDNACVPEGTPDPENECAACLSYLDTGSYSPIAEGIPCTDDGLFYTDDYCNGFGECIHPEGGICEIDGEIYTAGTQNPENDCQLCDPENNRDAWTNRVENYPCSDDELTCTSDVCNGEGLCEHHLEEGCLIEGACIEEGADDPENECAACLSYISTEEYSNKAEGVECTDDGLEYTDDYCDGAGACIHPEDDICLIDQQVYESTTPNAENICQFCDPATNRETWSNRVVNYPCDDDGLDCTFDVCDGEGLCEHNLYAGCLIDGVCIDERALDPENECMECNSSISTSEYSPLPFGTSCIDDGIDYTADICDGEGECIHPGEPPVDGDEEVEIDGDEEIEEIKCAPDQTNINGVCIKNQDLEFQGGAGADCNSMGNLSGKQASAMLLLLGLLLFGAILRRFRFNPKNLNGKMFWLGFFLVLFLMPVLAEAQEMNAETFQPSAFSLDLPSVQTTDTIGHMNFCAGLWANYANKPLALRNKDTGEIIADVITDRITTDIQFCLGLLDFMEIAVDIPVIWMNEGEADQFGWDINGMGVGDMRFDFKAAFLQRGEDRKGLGLAASVSIGLPTGDEKSFFGTSLISAHPRFILDYAYDFIGFSVNVGFLLRQEDQVGADSIGQMLTYGTGFWSELGTQYVRLEAEVAGQTEMSSDIVELQKNPMEFRGGFSFPVKGFKFFAGGGAGLIKGLGSPNYRIIAGLKYCHVSEEEETPPQVAAAPTHCKKGPEDFDGFEDDDDCIDPDNDYDRILDVEDKCPDDPEDYDGFEDEDGCPDPDNDEDGIPDLKDRCPLDPEVYNDIKDHDGCPDEGEKLMQPQKSKLVILSDIQFEFDSDVIVGDKSFKILNTVVTYLKANPNIRVQVEGHTCKLGSDEYNDDLSQRRANSVKRYLVSKGIASERLVAVGFGERRPIATNETEAGRELNRRVEFNFIE